MDHRTNTLELQDKQIVGVLIIINMDERELLLMRCMRDTHRSCITRRMEANVILHLQLREPSNVHQKKIRRLTPITIMRILI